MNSTDATSINFSKAASGISFDELGQGEPVLLLSGFPQTRASWHKIAPRLADNFHVTCADLPNIGGSSIIDFPASTENVARVFHEFVKSRKGRYHVVAHDVGAWVAFPWAQLFPEDFLSLTLMDAGIPGVTLKNDVRLTDFHRKWHFLFHILPKFPAELIHGREDLYLGWFYKEKVVNPQSLTEEEAKVYIEAYSRPGRMDAALDYYRMIPADIDFNESFNTKSSIPLLAVGADHSIPSMGTALAPHFGSVHSVIAKDSGHFVPEEQPEFVLRELRNFLKQHSTQRTL